MTPAPATDASALTPAQRLAVQFIRCLHACIGDNVLRTIVQRNRREQHPDICHSHDFCDANVVMHEAFSLTLGRDCVFLKDECSADAAARVDAAIWNEAWALAKHAEFDETLITRQQQPAADVAAEEPLAAAVRAADALLSGLMQANGRASAVQSLVLLPLIADARRAHDQLRALTAAIHQDGAS